MTYTKRMHDAMRRDMAHKQHNHIFDLLDEIERLQGIIDAYKTLYPNIDNSKLTGVIDSGAGKSTITGWVIKE